MPASLRLARRRGAPVLFALAAASMVLNGAGCASNKELAASAAPDYEDSFSARDYGYVRPALDVRVLGEGKGSHRRGGAASTYAGGPDLWDRVRAGMQLAHYADPRIDAKAEAFRRDPQYLAKLSQRARPYLHVVIGEIERRGLPAELALLPHVESRYNPAATSPKAAAGMWQFIPSTGRIMGLRQDHWHDDRRDLLASTRAAMDYLQQLNRRFGGDWELAMAAYNCGPGRVESALVANRLRGKPTDFWSLDLPTETENYVPQILAAARLVAEPAKYGLRLPPVPSTPQLELVRTQGPVDLARVAQASGVTLAELQRLNPGLKQGQTAPDGPGRLLVPAGYGKQITAKLASAQVVPAVPPAGSIRSAVSTLAGAERPAPVQRLPVAGEGRAYLVKAGESLDSIARAQGMESQTLADFNGMLVREPLLPGQTLRIPGASSGPVTAHRVKKGDSLGGIARRYGVTIGELKRWNQLGTNEVRAGDVIRILKGAG
ncbi:MAG: LysM peptidoglycan-binding domain-containing protein [Bdellovibrio bacteriovorus]